MDDSVPFFRPDIGQAEIDEVVGVLRSGWLTTGPKTRRLEQEFAEAVGGQHGVAVNSCTAALHLAVEAMGLRPGDAVLVPTLTFAATAEVVRYLGAIPILVDCDPETLNMDLADASRKADALAAGKLRAQIPGRPRLVGMIPVHVGGHMMDVSAVARWARDHGGVWVVEDAAHAFPASWRSAATAPWQRCGEDTSAISCFSFYANKTMTTGEGGIAITADPALADRMRMMSLHGLSQDAWGRYEKGGAWDYRIMAPGFKYNLTDIAAALGIHQLARAESMRQGRENVARRYREALSDVEEIDLPPDDPNRIHSWHLFPIRLRTDLLDVGRDDFLAELKGEGIGCSVHWRPLHLHTYYQDGFGWKEEDFPEATSVWKRLVSLPIFPSQTDIEVRRVVGTVKRLLVRHRKRVAAPAGVGC